MVRRIITYGILAISLLVGVFYPYFYYNRHTDDNGEVSPTLYKMVVGKLEMDKPQLVCRGVQLVENSPNTVVVHVAERLGVIDSINAVYFGGHYAVRFEVYNTIGKIPN